VIELQHLEESEREAAVRRLAEAEAGEPFDLSRGPLLRVKLLQLGAEEHVLLLTMHHIISDGWSMGVLIRELSALYEAYSRGEESPLAELPVQYADFAVWQREWLQGEVLERQLQYWREQLAAAAAVLELPTDRARAAVQSYRGAAETILLPVELSNRLKELSRGEGVTLFMTLLAAFDVLLYRYSGQEDFCVGSAVANRNRAETEGLIGFFVNTLVLRADLSGDPSFSELLGRVREVTLGAYAHQDVPFEQLVEELHPERRPSHQPLFSVCISFQNAPISTLDLPGVTLSPLLLENTAAHFDLSLYMMDTTQGLSLSLEYRTDLYYPGTIAKMLEHFSILLNEVAASPEQRLIDLLLLTEEKSSLAEERIALSNQDHAEEFNFQL